MADEANTIENPPDDLIRELLTKMLNGTFRIRATNEHITVHFDDYVYQYPRPEGLTAEKVLAAFMAPPSLANDDDVGPLKEDISNLDG